MPFYPALCRTARIQGEVTVRFTVDEHGDTANVEADGSNKLLKEARDSKCEELEVWLGFFVCLSRKGEGDLQIHSRRWVE